MMCIFFMPDLICKTGDNSIDFEYLTPFYDHGKFIKNKNDIRKNQDIERLRSVFAYIQDNYDKQISLLQLSKIACMSQSSLCRFFKKVTGTTAFNYILRIRVDRAKYLLIKSDLTISQISFKIGIEDHSYFDRIFRRFTNMSPKVFRRKHMSK